MALQRRGRAAALLLGLATISAGPVPRAPADDGRDWPGYGRTLGQQHYSPLADVDRGSVGRLGLAWSRDMPLGNMTTQPIAVGGVLYVAHGLSVVHAIDAASGRELWTYDPKVAVRAGLNLRAGWGVRGLAWSAGRLFVGTQDGRLIAIDARDGTPVWSVQTTDPNAAAHVNGAPRVMGGKVVIGFGGSTGVGRGYVSAYDAATGRRLWRFYTVPGDPAKGFEDAAQAMAARTWVGTWWRYGGGGDVWNAIAYDAETDTAYFGTGSGYPWNRRVRSADRGDNLFLSSIVAVDATTGAYKWHYQTTPGDTWDFDATMDVELADVTIAGRPRKVLMQAPKNGFFYVLDRLTGKPISAEPIAKVTWASRIDPRTGRPVEVAGARYETKPFDLWPTALGAHNWMSMAYNPGTRLAYVPVADFGASYADAGEGWAPSTSRVSDGALAMRPRAGTEGQGVPGRLVARSPVTQATVWQHRYPTFLNGGAMTTAGGLVFQGSVDGHLRAFAADTGTVLWDYDARAPILATPITYRAGGRQYVTVLTGLGMGYATNAAGLLGPGVQRYGLDPRTTPRRVLTFAIGGTATLPPRAAPPPAFADEGVVPDPAIAAAGAGLYHQHCSICHGALAIGTGHAPDLRRAAVVASAEGFAAIVKGGALVPRGMPAFADLSDRDREAIRHYLRTAAAGLRDGGAVPAAAAIAPH